MQCIVKMLIHIHFVHTISIKLYLLIRQMTDITKIILWKHILNVLITYFRTILLILRNIFNKIIFLWNILSNINFSLILFFHFKFSQSFDTLSDLFVLKHTSNVFQKCFYFTFIYIELCRFTYCLNFVLVNIFVARTIIYQTGWSI